MLPKLIKLSVLFSLLTLLPVQVVFADTGPKPSMQFDFRQELPAGEVVIASGILYECNQPDCSDAALLETLGPQGFFCGVGNCSATAYGFAPYHMLEIQFSDGITRRSNIFETAGFDSRYTVTVQPSDLFVEAQFNSGLFPRAGSVTVACICALLVVGLLAGLIIFVMRRSALTD